MIRFFCRLKHRKGFTLVEMIVVTALIGIIMASVVAFAGPMRDSVKNTEARSDALTINEVLGRYIEHNIAYSCMLDVFVGYTYENNVSEILNTYNSTTRKYKDSVGEANTTVKLFVAHFDDPDDPDDPANPPEKGTMKFYDVKITSSGLPSLATLRMNEYVFYDEFYGGYQYFLTMDEDDLGKNTNSRTKKAYLNLRLDSYNFGSDDAEDITKPMIVNYYNYITSHGTAGADDFQNIAISKTGSEAISFTLENIKATEISRPKTDDHGNKMYYSNGAPMWETYVSAGGAQIHRPSTATGTDIVILYKVKKY